MAFQNVPEAHGKIGRLFSGIFLGGEILSARRCGKFDDGAGSWHKADSVSRFS